MEPNAVKSITEALTTCYMKRSALKILRALKLAIDSEIPRRAVTLRFRRNKKTMDRIIALLLSGNTERLIISWPSASAPVRRSKYLSARMR